MMHVKILRLLSHPLVKCQQSFTCSRLQYWRRTASTAGEKRNLSRTAMGSWQIHDYGGPKSLTFSSTARVPRIHSPNEVLVEIHAASVNPIDVLMTKGYGKDILNVLRGKASPISTAAEFPLVFGRDFSGVITQKGKAVRNYKVGDEVWGTLGGQKQGSHAQFAVTDLSEISKKPKSLSHIDAASIPYVAATTWAALVRVGELNAKNTPGKRILVHGASGGIGTFAIQLLKAWGGHVTAICGTEGVDLVRDLRADAIIDYKTQDPKSELLQMEKFDLIYDPLGKEKTGYSIDFLKNWEGGKFVTIASPLLPETDSHGLLPGALKWGADLGLDIIKGFREGKNYRVAFFMPDGKALGTIAKMVDEEQIKPVVEKVFTFDEVPTAYEKVGQLHGRGKTVICVKP
ncbi:reticulon-4-interacting protein 1 homolog, mitochondrial-like [Ylistrum balloti]|uniref:reticulon-4-interacting protein 1 homolog, mitochondrial-like n=1 Tax=Ylistrum balloti TaxID=509963 RepID=UPI002905AF65|nr:reticulon-4-interacting protein 1 homolog, mitochondrial-like [Ylistrum balloti]